MERIRLSLKTLWKLYEDGQSLLQSRQFDAASMVFRRVADAHVRSRPGGIARRGRRPEPRPSLPLETNTAFPIRSM